jgi:hypothetical protein
LRKPEYIQAIDAVSNPFQPQTCIEPERQVAWATYGGRCRERDITCPRYREGVATFPRRLVEIDRKSARQGRTPPTYGHGVDATDVSRSMIDSAQGIEEVIDRTAALSLR